LVKQGNISNDELDSHLNFLKELSFFLFDQSLDSIDISDLKNFHVKYEKDFISPGFDTLMKNLKSANILSYYDSEIQFRFSYIFYFLVAKHISEIITTEKGGKVIKKLFGNLHNEKHANILIFVTHHTRDLSFMDEALFATMTPFEEINPITLSRGGEYYKHLSEFAASITDDVIELNRIPEEERKMKLISRDKASRADTKSSKIYNEDQNNEYIPLEHDPEMSPFFQSIRSIEIVGQIIKNRKGSLTKERISEMLGELYNTGFRTIGFMGELLTNSKEGLVKKMLDSIDDLETRQEIGSKINSFFHLMSLQVCLAIFDKIAYSVGVKELKDQYKDVATKLNTPASKLVSFHINTYFNNISAMDIQKLATEFKDNYVALQMLRIRAKNYIYNNHVDYKKKQKIAQALSLRLNDNAVIIKQKSKR
jgi:hypothetical protein